MARRRDFQYWCLILFFHISSAKRGPGGVFVPARPGLHMIEILEICCIPTRHEATVSNTNANTQNTNPSQYLPLGQSDAILIAVRS